MDAHKERVRSHYDAHAGNNISTEEALRDRRQGASMPLKTFHNNIKRQLLRTFTKPNCTLLDLCCGRGGDLHKWIDVGVRRALGVDISAGEVAEATRRYEEEQEKQRRKKQVMSLQAEFQVCDTLGDHEFLAPGGPYDLVTCMFAMHYFFEGERKLRMFLRNVARNLKPGGHFIGTIPDGKRVLWHLAGQTKYDSPFLLLEKKWQGQDHEVQPFGHQYLWALHNTVTEGKGESEGSLEFLTFVTPIVRVAAHYGMVPVIDYGDRRLEEMFESEDQQQPCKHFCPNFPGSDPSLMVASSTFMAFVFRKLDDDEVPVLNPPLLKTLPPRSEWGPPPFPDQAPDQAAGAAGGGGGGEEEGADQQHQHHQGEGHDAGGGGQGNGAAGGDVGGQGGMEEEHVAGGRRRRRRGGARVRGVRPWCMMICRMMMRRGARRRRKRGRGTGLLG